jgi:hypothetical protein
LALAKQFTFYCSPECAKIAAKPVQGDYRERNRDRLVDALDALRDAADSNEFSGGNGNGE